MIKNENTRMSFYICLKIVRKEFLFVIYLFKKWFLFLSYYKKKFFSIAYFITIRKKLVIIFEIIIIYKNINYNIMKPSTDIKNTY